MKNIRVLIFYIFIFVFSFDSVYAACNLEEEKLYKSNSSGFKLTYDYDKSTYLYSVYLYNPLPNSFIYDVRNFDDKIFCNMVDEFTIRCDNFNAGKVSVNILGHDNCIMDSIDVKLTFNAYYVDPICNGIEDFVLCSPTYDKEISYDEFVSRVNTYKENLSVNKDLEVETDKEEKDNKIIEIYNLMVIFVKDNLVLIITIIAALIILVVLVISIIKSYKSRWRLE